MMDMEKARFNLIEQQLRPNNISDPNVLNVLSSIKRDNFVATEVKNLALADLEINLPGQQKMLKPLVEAKLVQALTVKKTDKVLEIGAGSGYVTAVLAKLAEFVYALEIDETNRQLALHNLTSTGVNNVTLVGGNGLHGLSEKAPFNKIFIGGGLISVPDDLKKQLKVGGKLVGVVGIKPVMRAILIERVAENKYRETQLFETDVEYLIGEQTERFKF